jgi:tRNA pseudouridine55 synthase
MSADFVGDGVIVVDKPASWTSHDVVAKMRGIAGTRRVGHLGTLDPLATGVLPLMIGQATRLARYWDDSEKSYEAVIRFGFSTNSYDSEGEPTSASVAVTLDADRLEELLAPMRGEIDQIPPAVSAKKINGVPAYKLARNNEVVELAPVRIMLHELVLRGIDGDRARIFVRCSKGTYIRSIAHDLGQALGCGAHIEQLIRTASGPFRLAQAATLEHLQQLKNEGRLTEALLPPADLLPHFPSAQVDETVTYIRHGRDFAVSPFRVPKGAELVKAIGDDGRLVAIGRIVLPNLYHPEAVLASHSPDINPAQ